MPIGSSLAKPQAARLGSRLVTMRPPSSGGIGSRLRSIRTRLTSTPAALTPIRYSTAPLPCRIAASTRPAVPCSFASCVQASERLLSAMHRRRTSTQNTAIARFAAGPAAATHAMCWRGLRSAE